MSSETFPYGNDPLDPDSWVGSNLSKSKRWFVTYDGGFSMVLGYHSFIFMGLENMTIGIVNLEGGGPNVSLPIGKLLRGAWGLGEDAVKKVDDMLDGLGKAKTADDIYKRETEQADIDSGSALLARMREGIIESMVARKPFSMDNMNGMRGSTAGFDIELVGAASSYEIYGGTWENRTEYFGPKIVSSAG